MPASLPFTRSAADASSSTTATWVVSRVLPCASVRPRWSSSAATPAAPTATSVSPSRQVRPNVSLTTTATSTPSSSRSRPRSPRAEASASSGRSTRASLPTLEASMPAAATTQPCRVSTIRSGPRRATTRTVSASMARCRATSRSVPGGTGTSRPSTLETTLEVTTTTSPSASQGAAAAIAAARSSPGANSGRPGTGWTEYPGAGPPAGARREPASGGGEGGPSSDTGGVQGGPGQRGRGLRGGHQQRDPADVDAGDVGRVVRRDQPGVEQAAGLPGAVVPPDALGAHLDAEDGQAAVGHAADHLAADDGGHPDDAARRRQEGVAQAGHAEDRADGHHRVGGREQDGVGRGEGLDDAGRRPRRVDAHLDERRGLERRAVAHPP